MAYANCVQITVRNVFKEKKEKHLVVAVVKREKKEERREASRAKRLSIRGTIDDIAVAG